MFMYRNISGLPEHIVQFTDFNLQSVENKRKKMSPADDEFRKQFQRVPYICDLLFFLQPNPQN